jgi:hypothetical protein
MAPSAPHSHTKAPRWHTATRHANVGRESGTRSNTVHLGSVRRTTMVSIPPRLQTDKGRPHGPHRERPRRGRDPMVQRRRHHRLLRYHRSAQPPAHPASKPPRQALPALARRSPEGGRLRSMDLPPLTPREPTRCDRKPRTIQPLHGQGRPVRPRNAHARIDARKTTGRASGLGPSSQAGQLLPHNWQPRQGGQKTQGTATTSLRTPRRWRRQAMKIPPLCR